MRVRLHPCLVVFRGRVCAAILCDDLMRVHRWPGAELVPIGTMSDLDRDGLDWSATVYRVMSCGVTRMLSGDAWRDRCSATLARRRMDSPIAPPLRPAPIPSPRPPPLPWEN